MVGITARHKCFYFGKMRGWSPCTVDREWRYRHRCPGWLFERSFVRSVKRTGEPTQPYGGGASAGVKLPSSQFSSALQAGSASAHRDAGSGGAVGAAAPPAGERLSLTLIHFSYLLLAQIRCVSVVQPTSAKHQ